MVTLKNLTNKQHALLTKMWSLNTRKDLDLWMGTLEAADKGQALALYEVLLLEAHDAQWVEDLTLAQNTLAKYSK